MSAKITFIKSHPDFISGSALRTRKRIFGHSEHCYSGSSTNYWIKRTGKGSYLELYQTTEDSPIERQYSGTYSQNELQKYFSEAGFFIDDKEWLQEELNSPDIFPIYLTYVGIDISMSIGKYQQNELRQKMADIIQFKPPANAPEESKSRPTFIHSFSETKLLADNGDARAQFDLALMYHLGEGVSQNNAESVKYWRLLAMRGHPVSQYNLGASYLRGIGVQMNYLKAFNWFRRSAMQKHIDGLFGMGTMYLNGYATPIDNFRAYICFSLGSQLGDNVAGEFGDSSSKDLTKKEITAAKKLIIKCFESDFKDCPF